MSGKVDEHAMRILEALSEVDEELLARSNYEYSGKQRKPKRKLSVWRAVQACAAILCILAVGAAAWSGNQMKGGSETAGSGTMQGAMIDSDNAGNAAADNRYTEGADNTGGIAENQSTEELTDGNQNYRFEGEEEIFNQGNSQGAMLQVPVEDFGKEESKFSAEKESRTLTEEEARGLAGLGRYVPVKLPEGYEFEEAVCDADVENAVWMSLTWTADGNDYIMLSIRKEENDQDAPSGTIYSLADFDMENIENVILFAGEGNVPLIHFAVLYPEGVLVWCDSRNVYPEDIWEVFCSIEAGS